MRRAIAAVVLMGAVLSGCVDDGPIRAGYPDPAFLGRNVDSGFRPETGGFSFANFSELTYRERFAIDDMIDVVGGGPRVCRDGLTDPCIPTEEAQSFIDIVENARRAGHCEGMVVLAAVRHEWGLSPVTADLEPMPHVVDAIIRAFATMFLPEVANEGRTWATASLADVVAVLAEQLHAGHLDYGMGLYTENGGHEVLPYAIDYPAPDHARVWVYDPNWPLTQRWVDIDLATETWRFSFAGSDPDSDPYAWSGDHTMLDLNSISVRAAALEARGVDLTPPGR